MLVRCKETGQINIDCVDPLGRSALLMAIDNENLEMVDLLLENKVIFLSKNMTKSLNFTCGTRITPTSIISSKFRELCLGSASIYRALSSIS